MAKILILPLPAYGHVNPTLPMARELVERGEEVIYCLPDAFQPAIASTGATLLSSPLANLQGFRRPPLSGPVPLYWLPLDGALASFQLLPPLLKRVQVAQPDVLIYDAWCLWGRLLARLLHLPAVRFNTTFVLNEQLGPTFSAILAEASHMFVTPQTWAPWTGGAGPLTYQRAIEHLCATYQLPPITLTNFFDHAEALNLVPIPPTFQPGIETFDERFQFIGPAMGARHEEADFPPGLHKTRPLLYISLGTIDASDWTREFFTRCFTAFGTGERTTRTHTGEQPWQVLLSTGPTDPVSLGPPPTNVLVHRSVPQLKVLAQTSVFLTHGGMNSVMEALAHGVPLVMVPQSPEEALTAARVEELGLGILLQRTDVTAARLREAVTRLANDQQVQARCRQMRTILREGGGPRQAVEAIRQFSRTQAEVGWCWPASPRKPKVFGIGLSRTGTTSLTDALHLLGYSAVHFPQDAVTRAEVYRSLACRPASVSLSVLQEADALTDIPVCCLYQALDRGYPGSKFILTVREKHAWLRSCETFWRRHVESAARVVPDGPIIQYMRAMDTHLYGTFAYEAEGFSRAYDRYCAEVLEYFKDRPEDLLILDITTGQGWNELAPFLGLAIPQLPFPWENRGQSG